MTIDAIREATNRLTTATTALAALAARMEQIVDERPLDPSMASAVDGVLDALGLANAFDGVSAADLRPVLGEIRVLGRGASLAAGRWTPTESDVLQAAGDVTARFPIALQASIAPKLEGLAERLATPGSAFIDVGAGVAALSIAMARTFPHVRIVGIDPWAPALAVARSNVRAADLESRIELREIAGELLDDERAFDLAWVAALFVPEKALPEVLRRVRRALRPGGWLLLPLVKASTDPLVSAVTRLRVASWGGSSISADEGERLLAELGFEDVRRLANAPAASTVMIAAR